MSVPPSLRSFRIRIALLSAAGTGVIIVLFGVFLHEWLRRGGLRSIDRLLEAQARIVLSQPDRPIRWHEIDRRLQQDGVGTAFFVWLAAPGDHYTSTLWPKALDPRAVLPSMELPSGWEERAVVTPDARNRRRPPGPGEFGDPPDGPPEGRERGARDADLAVEVERLSAQPQVRADSSRRYAAYSRDDMTLILGTETRELEAELANFRLAILIALPGALLLAFGTGLFVAGRSLRTVDQLARAVEQISATGLDTRIKPLDSDREFARLVSVFNDMLGRLERSFQEARHFSDNAAHELRTPLTILQGKLDAAIQSEQAGSERQQYLTELLDEVARLKGIIDHLLLLARSDSGRLDLYPEKVDLSLMLEGMVDDIGILAPHLVVTTKIPPGIVCECDRSLVAQIIHNLLSNAIKYNHRNEGTIHVGLKADDRTVVLSVTNSGRPIPPELHARVFERFFRAEQSRSRRVEGTGLGLSLAREIARAHKGDLVLRRSDERGTKFQLALPMALPESSAIRRARVSSATGLAPIVPPHPRE